MPNPDLVNYITSRIRSDDYVLDVGCGQNWVKQTILNPGRVVGIDINAGCHPEVEWDLNNGLPICFAGFFDVILLIDVVEHLYKSIGERLISLAQGLVVREVLLLVPMFWTHNRSPYEDQASVWYQRREILHRSEWNEGDFRADTG